MHGQEDGSIPATFQIIYMASKYFILYDVLVNSTIDWMETITKSTEAS
jgi:hypothetical protein